MITAGILGLLLVVTTVAGESWRKPGPAAGHEDRLRPAAEAQDVVTTQGRPARQPQVDPLTASIRGRVTTADTGTPVRRAEVRASVDGGIARLATTDLEGRFEFRDLPAGRYRVHVTKSGFVPVTYGQRRALEAPSVIDLKQGQQAAANVALPRGGAITGRVIDEAGEPVVDVRMQALRPRMVEGRRRLQPIGPADVTDDTGAFRLYGLPPGDYIVSAAPPRGEALRIDMRSTIFYPGTPNPEEAQRVTLGAGGEVRADLQLVYMRAAVVSGVVVTSSGAPAADAQISLISESISIGPGQIAAPLTIGGHSADDGTFVVADVPPGAYTLRAVASDVIRAAFIEGIRDAQLAREQGLALNAPFPPVPETAMLAIVVGNADVSGLTLVTSAGGTIEGRFVQDAGVSASLPAGLSVEVRSAVSSQSLHLRQTAADGFRITGVSGPSRLQVQGLPDGWAVKAIVLDGVDMTDSPLTIPSGRTANVRIVVTNRTGVVNGTVADDVADRSDDRPIYRVVVFAEDAGKWTYPSRHQRTVTTDEKGAFTIRGLPGGQRYLAVAVDYLEDGEGADPEFLDAMRERAASFTLDEGERTSLALRLIHR